MGPAKAGAEDPHAGFCERAARARARSTGRASAPAAQHAAGAVRCAVCMPKPSKIAGRPTRASTKHSNRAPQTRHAPLHTERRCWAGPRGWRGWRVGLHRGPVAAKHIADPAVAAAHAQPLLLPHPLVGPSSDESRAANGRATQTEDPRFAEIGAMPQWANKSDVTASTHTHARPGATAELCFAKG